MGHARSTFSCLISSSTTLRPKRLLRCCLYKRATSTPKNGVLQKKLILTIRAIMIAQQIDVVAGDFNGTAWRCSNRDNISTIDELQTVRCQRRRALHHCGEPDRFQTTGLTSVGSLNRPIQIGTRRYACMVRSPSHAKLSACVHPIKIAIMRHGSTWISSIGANPNHITKNLTDEFYSKSVLRQLIKGRRRGGSVIL